MNLVTVGGFETPEEAEHAKSVLASAGIVSDVRYDGQTHTLLVPEDAAYAAVQSLAISDDDEQTEPASVPACPECGGFETRRIPSYAAIVLAVSVIAAVTVYLLGHPWPAFLIFIAGWILTLWFSRLLRKHRCSRCGWGFTP